MNKLIIPFLLIIAFLSVGCSDDETKDAVKEIKMSVSSETGTRWVFGGEQPIVYACYVGRQSRSMGTA